MPWPAWAAGLWARAQPFAERLAVWRGYEAELTSLTILILGMAFYTLLVFAFYQNLSQREAFHTGFGGKGRVGRLVAALENVFVFPVMSFLYFSVLAGVLFFLAKSQSTYQIFLLSMAVVGSVRLTSFFSEIASGDLAKLLPLSLLGVLVVDPTYATWAAVWARYQEVPSLVPILGRFFLLFLVFETGLRVATLATARFRARSVPVAVEASVPPRTEPVTSLEIVEAHAEPKAP